MTAAPPPGHAGPVVDTGVATVLELVDREVAAHPEAPAVREPGRVVTYAELDRLADTVADRLGREFGIGRGDVVLIAARAGVDFTAALLGTLRAGAAYLPVDTTYPPERVEQILRASSAALLVLAEPGVADAMSPSARTTGLADLVAPGAAGAPAAP
ncbi:AMP-binding protein, partial [Streptomyces sp. NPDC047123]|uniref:AMP-binding protein n=1 Tax=Streptomyces sp. NPDC047123 TaxID=3155622 RepID=UPI0033EF5EF5